MPASVSVRAIATWPTWRRATGSSGHSRILFGCARGETRQSLTERAPASFASVAQALRERGHNPQPVAHFVNRLVFCMFADDVGLLPDHMFTRMLRHAHAAPKKFSEFAGELFEVMAFGGRVGFETVAWFNGGLFDDADALPLERSDIETVLADT